ncbi:DUF4136 domain-containing protein [Pseudomonadota bacterium]
MTRVLSVLFLMSSAWLLGGCATAPTSDIEVNAQTSPDYAPSEYKTYAWLATAEIINDAEGNWEPPKFDADAEIKRLIDREMQARGIKQVAAFPNVFVAFAAGVDMDRLELKEDPRQKIEVLQNAPKGALAVMLIDGATGSPVWAGAAVGDVKGNRTPEESKARLEYAVRQMFRKLPGSEKAGAESADY